MAVIRYRSVQDRVAETLRTLLAAIRRGDGYNTDVKHVWRRQDIPMFGVDPPEIFLVFGDAMPINQVAQGTDDRVRVRAPMDLHLYVTCGDIEQETEFQCFRSDVYRILNPREPLTERYGPRNQPVYCQWLLSRSYNTEMFNATVHGRIAFEVEYWHLRTDDRLWDAEDTLVEVGQVPRLA